MMRIKQRLRCAFCAAAALAAVLSGCADTAATSLYEGTNTLTGVVTAIEGSSVTLLAESGNVPQNISRSQLPNTDDAAEEQSEFSSQKPNAAAPETAHLPIGEKDGNTLPTGEETVQFTISASCVVTIADVNGENTAGSLHDIIQGALITVEFGADGAAFSVAVSRAAPDDKET